MIGNRMSDTKKDLRLSGLMEQAPALQIRDKDQIAALPLGSHIGMDPWSDRLHLIKPTADQRFTAKDKLPFEITPFEIHLTRQDSRPPAAAATAPATPPATTPADQAAVPVARPQN